MQALPFWEKIEFALHSNFWPKRNSTYVKIDSKEDETWRKDRMTKQMLLIVNIIVTNELYILVLSDFA